MLSAIKTLEMWLFLYINITPRAFIYPVTCGNRTFTYILGRQNLPLLPQYYGDTRWCSWLRHCPTNRMVAGLIPECAIGIFQWQSIWPHYGPGVDSASNRNEYQEYFLGGKSGRCIWLTTLPLQVPIVSWNLGASTSWNPQGLSRPVMGLLNFLPHYYK
jgi:hypothetical protein